MAFMHAMVSYLIMKVQGEEKLSLQRKSPEVSLG